MNSPYFEGMPLSIFGGHRHSQDCCSVKTTHKISVEIKSRNRLQRKGVEQIYQHLCWTNQVTTITVAVVDTVLQLILYVQCNCFTNIRI